MPIEFPIIYLLPTHLGSQERHDLEKSISSLTNKASEAQVIVGRVSRTERAVLELRYLGLIAEDAESSEPASSHKTKRRRISRTGEQQIIDDDELPDSGDEIGTSTDTLQGTNNSISETVKVIKLAWLQDSLEAGVMLPTDGYLVYEGRKVTGDIGAPAAIPGSASQVEDLLKRAQADASNTRTATQTESVPRSCGKRHDHHQIKHPALLQQNTSEDDATDLLPPVPEYLHTMYSCERPSPVNPPNEAFIAELKKIRTTRTLEGDQVGIRAYSSAIATLVAYPYVLQGAKEVAQLPGCANKIAALFQEFKDTGGIREVREAESDPRLRVLESFYNIWGVGDVTAREFYRKGWRDLDDIIEFGWDSLTRVQQIGVKYYDEFLFKIPKVEIEKIANTILGSANSISPGFHMVIVGSYRRGKPASGDVDVILSHPDEAATREAVVGIVNDLDGKSFVSHTLSLATTNSERGQEPLPWKGDKKGSGFDTLDKALVVWQDPEWTTGENKNPNPHRRVDIIISPWKTVGCAVLGWTGGTTFQRDLRRYCRKERSWKFDSSGIRSRLDGRWIDLESGPDGSPAPDPLTAERRVFEGLGLEFRAPEERCTR